jgi:hypothetical protein
MAALLIALISQAVAVSAGADPLTVTRKSEIPTYSESSIMRGAIYGAASGLAVGAGVGIGLQRLFCQSGVCPQTAKTVVPAILVGGVLGASIGAVITKLVGSDSPFVAYPTVGIGSYGSAPALMFEGRF